MTAPTMPPPADQQTADRDVYAVVALALALGAVGFLLGPAMTSAFGWAFGIAAAVFGSASRTGATAAVVIGVLAAIVSLASIVANWL